MLAMTPYQVLDLTPDATAEEIKRNYKKLALKYHPDKDPSDAATAKFQEIGAAYAIIGDVDSRRRYDAAIAKGVVEEDARNHAQDPVLYPMPSPAPQAQTQPNANPWAARQAHAEPVNPFEFLFRQAQAERPSQQRRAESQPQRPFFAQQSSAMPMPQKVAIPADVARLLITLIVLDTLVRSAQAQRGAAGLAFMACAMAANDMRGPQAAFTTMRPGGAVF